jgi:hypothetical protein
VHPILAGLSLIDLAVLAGIAVVVPVALRRAWLPWLAVAGAAAVAFRQDRGSAAAVLLAVPWVLLAAGTLLALVRAAGPVRSWTVRSLPPLLSAGYLLAASAWLVISRAGGQPTGISEPIVELTAVHFTYIGVGAITLAAAAEAGARGRRAHQVGVVAVVLTAGVPPLVAVGFVTGWALPQVMGAVLLTIGVWCTAGLELQRSIGARVGRLTRALLLVSGLAVWVPMVLAVAWAAGEHWDVPALSIPDMVRTHGAVNAICFIGAGLLAMRLERQVTEAD